MIRRAIVITAIDRSRLGSMVQAFRAEGLEHREQLDALEAELEQARAVEPTEMPDDVITMNSTVRFRDPDSGRTETYTLVYPDYDGMSEKCVSVLSPNGLAMFGCRIGDVVRWKGPSETRQLVVDGILFQPESAHRYDL
jgi:regulator of nucleoside diphosphate kinase